MGSEHQLDAKNVEIIRQALRAPGDIVVFGAAWVPASSIFQIRSRLGRGRIRTYVENLQQIYSLSLLTTRPLSL